MIKLDPFLAVIQSGYPMHHILHIKAFPALELQRLWKTKYIIRGGAFGVHNVALAPHACEEIYQCGSLSVWFLATITHLRGNSEKCLL